ncbi:uncharacterized protein [Centroberyx affinis]|uniref:uncharacterized protein n=1 Tax=Centroberyx affinis TaxID=166261 RepID=UPI003A5BD1B9
MEHRVFMLPFAALVLVTFSVHVQGWDAPEFCHECDCPEYAVVQNSPEFEERLYVGSYWISTKVPSSEKSDLMDGYYKLKGYCERQKEAGHEIPAATWPALINITEGEDGSETSVFMSWFVPPGTSLPTDTNSDVTLEFIPPATVYVSVFGGIPNHDRGRETANELREALVQAGKSFERHRYIGAGYENPLNVFISHRNEIWIYASSGQQPSSS